MAVFSEKNPTPGSGRDGVPGLSIIGAGMRVIGDISADGVVKIEGSVNGTVRAAKQVLVARGGEVEGDVVSREAIRAAGDECRARRRAYQATPDPGGRRDQRRAAHGRGRRPTAADLPAQRAGFSARIDIHMLSAAACGFSKLLSRIVL